MHPQQPIHRLRLLITSSGTFYKMELIVGSFLLVIVSLVGHIGFVVVRQNG